VGLRGNKSAYTEGLKDKGDADGGGKRAKQPDTLARENTLLITKITRSMIHGAQCERTPGVELLVAVMLQVSWPLKTMSAYVGGCT
jgi:hypothetical protein